AKSDISIWVYSVPGVGKTTMVQEINKQLKAIEKGFSYVDMANEILNSELIELAEVDIFAVQKRIKEQNNPIKIETSHE
ncbi:AAA family ATPase, partial [Escherichia coli]|uniref:AAA family ATPase n=1 Tax=Escherichia coli TaxID=562 RepID=UPI0021F387DF